ncbi:MAG: N-glycosylase/DNA lyase [archaeon]|nr:N-glycosylase/DNA lyase [archaeon]
MRKDLDQLIKAYQIKKDEIQRRISEFKGMLNESDERLFAELAFCLCTPQSKATTCWDIVSSLMRNGLLFKGNEEQIRSFLNAIRFGDNKAKYIVSARRFFTEDYELRIKDKILSFDDLFKLREWLVEKILGIGMKEASHFLRNIGLGKDLAILDRHILKNLKEYRVISEIPKSITKKVYINIEDKMKEFSKRINIPMDELDLLFWSKETGIIFK